VSTVNLSVRCEADKIQQLADTAALLGSLNPLHLEAEGDVLAHGHVKDRATAVSGAPLLNQPAGPVANRTTDVGHLPLPAAAVAWS
jgi:hypothetical protein